jgi:hypothetical protein
MDSSWEFEGWFRVESRVQSRVGGALLGEVVRTHQRLPVCVSMFYYSRDTSPSLSYAPASPSRFQIYRSIDLYNSEKQALQHYFNIIPTARYYCTCVTSYEK